MFATAMLTAQEPKQERAAGAPSTKIESTAPAVNRGTSRAFSYAMLAVGVIAFAIAQITPIFMTGSLQISACMIPGSLWAIASVGGFLAMSFLMDEDEQTSAA